MSVSSRLRGLLAGGRPVIAPLALDPLSARTAARAGFEALYIGGGALGYVSTFTEATLELSELIDVGLAIRAACDLPLILDGTCGWGDPMHLHRTVVRAESAGFAAIEIEDQVLPKRAHHHVGVEHLIPTELMAAKIHAAVSARVDPDFVVIARTNACRTHDLNEALERAEAYRAAGADLLLVLPSAPEQTAEIGRRTDLPLVAMPPAGLSPSSLGVSLQEAHELGYQLIVDATTPLLARQHALRLAYEAIANGSPDPTIGTDHAREVEDIHDLIGLSEMLEIERRTVEG